MRILSMQRPALWARFLPAVGLLLLASTAVQAQGGDAEPLRLINFGTSNVRTALSDNWTAFDFGLANLSATGRQARLVAFFPDRPDAQYARDVWVPGHSTLATWMLVGPSPEQQTDSKALELEVLLYDRTGGQERLVLPPGEQRVRTRTVPYRRREAVTTVLLDPATRKPEPGRPVPPATPAEEVVQLVRTFRQVAGLSERVQMVGDQFLPPLAAALDGVDHVVVAGRHLANDLPGQAALRRWVEQGGKLWVMLDQTDPDLVARLLGDSLGFQVVDRTSLTTVRFQGQALGPTDEASEPLEFEQPVDLVRVALTPEERVLHTVNGWPASFTRQLGQGQVLFTTLGARAWHRPRTAHDPRSPYSGFPDLPVAQPALQELALELQPPAAANAFRVDALTPLVSGEIGYAVLGRGKAALIFAGFVLAVLLLGIVLRQSRRPELLGALAPAAAVAAAAVFLATGEVSRRAVPPTVAVAQMVVVVPGADEQPITGLLAAYRPDAGPAPLASTHGGLLDLDMAGLEGRTRRLVVTDLGAWHWENLDLPAGMRLGSFQYTARTGPPAALGHFGPAGLEGKLDTGSFREPSDLLIHTPARQAVAVRLRADGSFTAGAGDVLAPGQYLAGAVLSDRQQRRQAIYSRLLAEGAARYLQDRTALLAWTDPVALPFTPEPGAPTVGSALLAVPVEFERTPPDTRVTVPSAFLPYRRLLRGRAYPPTLQSAAAIAMELRFQVPPSVLPLQIERARLVARIRAPLRRVTIAGHADGRTVELRAVQSPTTDPIQVDIVQPELLRLDEQGGLHVDVAVSEPPEAAQQDRPGEERETGWTIDALELEVTGRTAPPR